MFAHGIEGLAFQHLVIYNPVVKDDFIFIPCFANNEIYGHF